MFENDIETNLVLARLDQAIEEAGATWVDVVSNHATWPIRENFTSAEAYHNELRDFEEFLIGEETRNISRLLFQLKSAPVDTIAKMEKMIDAHNRQIEADLSDDEYDLQTGVSRARLVEAQMLTEGEREILLNAVARHGAGVLHESGYSRFLVRISNPNRMNKTVNVLKKAELIRVIRGANNAKLVISDGALEAAHKAYLVEVSVALREMS